MRLGKLKNRQLPHQKATSANQAKKRSSFKNQGDVYVNITKKAMLKTQSELKKDKQTEKKRATETINKIDPRPKAIFKTFLKESVSFKENEMKAKSFNKIMTSLIDRNKSKYEKSITMINNMKTKKDAVPKDTKNTAKKDKFQAQKSIYTDLCEKEKALDSKLFEDAKTKEYTNLKSQKMKNPHEFSSVYGKLSIDNFIGKDKPERESQSRNPKKRETVDYQKNLSGSRAAEETLFSKSVFCGSQRNFETGSNNLKR